MADLMTARRRILLNTPHLETASGAPVTFITDRAAPLTRCTVQFAPVQSGSGDQSPANLRPISGWTGLNLTSSPGTMIPVDWTDTAGTLYAGCVDLVSGELIAEWYSKTYTGAASEAWGKYASVANHYQIGVSPANLSSMTEAFAISNAYPGRHGLNTSHDYGVLSVDGSRIRVRDIGCASVAEFKARLQSLPGGLQVVYKLATPIHYSISPVTVRVLRGQNQLAADTGGLITVDFWTH